MPEGSRNRLRLTKIKITVNITSSLLAKARRDDSDLKAFIDD
jgi:hypothetical protein